MTAFFSRCLILASLAGLAWPGSASALDQIRFGKAVPNSFAFGAAEVGVQAKIYEQEGIDLQILTFQGDARIQQALTADGIDVAVGSRPGKLRVSAKGVPAIRGRRHVWAAGNLCLTWCWPARRSRPLRRSPRASASKRHHRGLASPIG